MKHNGVDAHIASYIQRRPGTTAFWIMLVLSLFFLVFQSVDIATSAQFFDPETNRFMGYEPVLRRLRELGLLVPKLIVAGLVISVAVKLILPKLKSLVPPQVTLFVLSTLILGPGLLVNGILKAHWGRPRPRNTDLFSGDLPFMPPWIWSDHCARNCSFVSGEASSSFFVLFLAFLVPKDWRLPTLMVLVPYVVLMSFNRVMFGGHYLSDIMIAWPLNFLIMLGCYRYFIASPPPALRPSRLEDGLEAISNRLIPSGSSVDQLRTRLMQRFSG